MNILMLAPELLPIRGGAGAYLKEVAARAPDEVNVHLLTHASRNWKGVTEPVSSLEGACFGHNVEAHTLTGVELPVFRSSAFKAMVRARLREFVRRYRIDIIHSCSTMPDLLVNPRAGSPPIVTTVHSTVEDHYNALRSIRSGFGQLNTHEKAILTLGPLLINVEDFYYRGRRRYISVSEWGKENLIKLKNVQPNAIRVIHNGVDSKAYRPTSDAEGRKFFPEVADVASPRVLILSRLTTSKLTPYLTEAIRRMSKTTDVHFVIAGSGDRELLGLPREACTLLGHVPHELTPYLYSLCDVYVLASLYENFPISILEAMACECPVVASNIGGIPEVIEDGRNGVLVSPRDTDELIRKILFLTENADEAKRVGRLGRERVTESYSWDSTATKTYSLFEEISNERLCEDGQQKE